MTKKQCPKCRGDCSTKLPILTMVKNVMFGPACGLCGGRKSMKLNNKHYCPVCEKHILDLEVARGL